MVRTCLIASSIISVTALIFLVAAPQTPSAVTLPVGLPWLGAHFRIDALSAFFLAVVDLGAAAASLFALRLDCPPLRRRGAF